jgi:hypothetical protein
MEWKKILFTAAVAAAVLYVVANVSYLRSLFGLTSK